MWASVIWVGKRDSCYHPISSFSENVIVAETSYQMLEVLFLRSGEGFTSSSFHKANIVPVTIFGEKSTMYNEAFRGV